uniref:HOOK N-terminal domain-containing protein n=1 Tax=Dendroctonus ponderosae TaxID=77166 RepID=A0AAR5Q1L8_DENPD
MEGSLWDAVLIKWVNCTRLSQPIQTLDQLQNGEFLSRMSKLIETSDESINSDGLSVIFETFSRYYPHIVFEKKESVHVSDLPYQDLVNMTSLLLHFTSICKRKDALTSAMCKDLDLTTQLYIKKFLESVSQKTTNKQLAKTIEGLFGASKKPKSSREPTPVQDSPMVRKSPLFELLQTPRRKYLRIKGANMVKTLEQELEAERADREADVKKHQEIISKLTLQLEQKCTEAKQLKAQVNNWEESMPPNSQDVDHLETIKLLRREVASLEDYVKKCDNEYEEITKEKDSFEAKAKQLEADCKTTKSSFLELEEIYLVNMEASKELEEKYRLLNIDYVELRAMLNEYRRKSIHLEESVCYESRRWSGGFDSSNKGETLAESVVEVQLRDVRTALDAANDKLQETLQSNDELKAALKEAEQRNELQLLEGDKLKHSVRAVQTENADLQAKLQQLSEQLCSYQTECENLKAEKLELNDKILQLASRVDQSSNRIQTLEAETERLSATEVKLTETLARSSEENQQLSIELKHLEKLKQSMELQEAKLADEKALVEQRLAAVEETLEATRLSKTALQTQQLQSVEQLQTTSAELQKVRSQTEILARNLEATSKGLEHSKAQLAQTQCQVDKLLKEKREVEDTLAKTEAELARSHADIKAVQLEKESLNFYLEDTSKQLDESEDKLASALKAVAEQKNAIQAVSSEKASLETKLEQSNEETKGLSTKLSELSLQLQEAIRSLETTKNTLAEKCESESQLQQVIKELKQALQIAQEEAQATEIQLNRKLEEIKQSSDSAMENQAKKLQHTLMTLDGTRTELEDSKCALHQSNEKLTQKERELTEKVQQFHELELQLVSANATLKEHLEYELDLEKQLEALKAEKKQQLESLKAQLGNCRAEVALYYEKLEATLAKLNQSNGEIESLNSQLTESWSKVERLSADALALKTSLSCSVAEKEQISQLLEGFFQKLHHIFEPNHIGDLASQLDHLVVIVNQLEDNQCSLTKTVDETAAKLQAAQEEKTVLANFLELNSDELRKVAQENEHILEALEMSNKDKMLLEAEHTQLELQVASMEHALEQLRAYKEKKSQEKQKLFAEKAAILEDLQETIREKNELKKLELHVASMEHELEQVRACNVMESQEKQKLFAEKAEILEDLQKTIREKDELKQLEVEVASMEQELNQLRACYQKENQEKQKLFAEKAEILDDLQKTIREKDELKQLEVQVASMEQELEQLRACNEKESQEKQKLFAEKAEILENLQKTIREKDELKQLEVQVASMEQDEEKEKLLDDKAEILENLQKIIREKDELFRELFLLREQQELHQAKDIEIGNLRREIQQLEQASTETRNEKEDIYEYLQNAVQEKEELSLQLDKVQSDNVTLSKEREALQTKLQDVGEEKRQIQMALELSRKETLKVKKERIEILQTQTEIIKETEAKVLQAHNAAVEEKRQLLQRVQQAEKERDVVRQAYTAVMTKNSKCELEMASLKQIIEERTRDVQRTSNLKEAYEKLLDDNCTLMQKRENERKEYVTLLMKEQQKAEKKIGSIKAAYEEKLEKMIQKLTNDYKEQMLSEREKFRAEKAESVTSLQKTIDDLRGELYHAEEKLQQAQGVYSSRESLRPSTLRGRSNKVGARSTLTGSTDSLFRDSNVSDQITGRNPFKLHETTREFKTSTLPSRLHTVEETITISRRTSTTGPARPLEMEDEEDNAFSNKYLNELREGRSLQKQLADAVAAGGASNSSRVSELARRNTMVPAHLKSSYPLETQYVSLSTARDEDIKSGQVNLDDSLSKLLPGEKPRQKKDFGTTSYKKPGPPTPSKNGGRASLQGNEPLPLRETNATHKQVTPGRIRTLFKGLRDGMRASRDNSEVTLRGLFSEPLSCSSLICFVGECFKRQLASLLCRGIDFL